MSKNYYELLELNKNATYTYWRKQSLTFTESKNMKVAIMFTDVANFTHFMSVDEKKALNFLEHKKAILNQLVQSYNGEYIKDIGDGTLTYYLFGG